MARVTPEPDDSAGSQHPLTSMWGGNGLAGAESHIPVVAPTPIILQVDVSK